MILRNLLLSTLLFISSCATIYHSPVIDTLANSREAIVHLTYDGGSCTAFHIGNERFLTASHCFKDTFVNMKPIRLTDSNEDIYLADVVRFSVKKDLVLLSVPGFTGPSLEIWNPQWDGEPPIGMELIAMGYPAYYATEFSWEQGFLKDIATVKGIEMLVSEESSYSGESGGPVVSTANGKVMGIVEAGVEQIAWLAMLDHSHVSISLFISANEINSFLR